MYSPPKILLPLLWPLSLIYGAAVVVRAWLYERGILKQKRLNGVVISVGNLTVGGTGKTPMVLWLTKKLHERAIHVGILTRGYLGFWNDRTGFAFPPRSSEIPHEALGDEVRLLWEHLGKIVPIGVGADRYMHGWVLQRDGVEQFVLDDGFQHLPLHRDLDIVLIDARVPFGGHYLLPAGRCREPLSALARADMIVITRSQRATGLETVIRRHTSAPVLYAATFLERVVPGEHSYTLAVPERWLGRKVFAFCGIGNSSAFFEDVNRWGMELVGSIGYRDHHRYNRRDVAHIETLARAAGAEALICTEKDTYNLGQNRFEKLPQYVCHVTMRPVDEERFWREAGQIIQRKRGGELPQ